MKFEPTGDKILLYVPAEKESTTASGIVTLARETQELSYRSATVIATGIGRRSKTNVIIPPEVKVGDTVYVLRYQGMSVSPDSVGYNKSFNIGDELRLVLMSDIALVVENEEKL